MSTENRIRPVERSASSPSRVRGAVGRRVALALLGFLAAAVGGAAIAAPRRAAADSLLVSAVFQNRVLRYDAATGAYVEIFTVGGGLMQPHAVAVGADGNLYVGGATLNSVLRYHGQTGVFLDTFVPAGSGGLLNPHGLAFGPDGHLYVCSQDSNQVLRYDGTTGAFLGVFASGGGLTAPYDFAFRGDGYLYVTASTGNQVLRYDATTGAFVGTFASGGGLNGATGLVFGPDGHLYVSSYFSDRILRYNGTSGAFMDTFVPLGSGGLDGPLDLVFGPDGNLYVASYLSDRVLRYNGTTGAFLNTFIPTNPLTRPAFLLFVSNPVVLLPRIAVSFGAPEYHVNAGGGTYVDTDGRLFVADQGFAPGGFGYTGGTPQSFASGIAGTVDDPLYQAMRGASSFSYSFDALSAGFYDLTLSFAEPTVTFAGARRFDVIVEGGVVLNDYDVFGAAGGQFIANRQTVSTNVTDGRLNVDFVGVTKNAIVSALSVVGRSLDAGSVAVGGTGDRTVTIANVGTADLEVSAFAVANPAFTVIGPATPFAIPAGQTQDVTVRFSPTALGTQTSGLDIASDDPTESVITLHLTGAGVAPPTATPTPTAPPVTSTPSDTPTPTPSATATETATTADTATATPTATDTATPADTPTATPSGTAADTATSTATVTPTPTSTDTGTPADTPTATPSVTPADTATSTATVTPTPTSTDTATPADTPTATPSGTAADTATSTATVTPTPTSTDTATPADTFTETPTGTPTQTVDSSATATPTATPTDTGTPTATAADTATATPTVTPTDTPEVAWRINCGGGAYVDSSGKSFAADQPYTAGGFGYFAGQPSSVTNPIAGTVDDPLYQTMRGGTTFSYNFDNVPSGTYSITLYFTEPIWNQAGARRFDVRVEGGLVLAGYDIFAAAGGTFVARTETVTVTVSDGQLNIQFTSVVRIPIVSAIAAVRVGP